MFMVLYTRRSCGLDDHRAPMRLYCHPGIAAQALRIIQERLRTGSVRYYGGSATDMTPSHTLIFTDTIWAVVDDEAGGIFGSEPRETGGKGKAGVAMSSSELHGDRLDNPHAPLSFSLAILS